MFISKETPHKYEIKMFKLNVSKRGFVHNGSLYWGALPSVPGETGRT
jgi:hypothetical protein